MELMYMKTSSHVATTSLCKCMLFPISIDKGK